MSRINAVRFVSAQRQLRVSELYLSGLNQTEIAERLDVSQATVHRDIRNLLTTWKTSIGSNTKAMREKELEKLRLVQREAWQAWERSQLPRERRRAGGGRGDAVAASGETEGSTSEMEMLPGDPRFLALIFRCIALETKIMSAEGLESPQEPLAPGTQAEDELASEKQSDPDAFEEHEDSSDQIDADAPSELANVELIDEAGTASEPKGNDHVDVDEAASGPSPCRETAAVLAHSRPQQPPPKRHPGNEGSGMGNSMAGGSTVNGCSKSDLRMTDDQRKHPPQHDLSRTRRPMSVPALLP